MSSSRSSLLPLSSFKGLIEFLLALVRGFVVQPERWVVERIHAWSEHTRRLMAHHGRSNRAPVAWVWLAQARSLATRLVT